MNVFDKYGPLTGGVTKEAQFVEPDESLETIFSSEDELDVSFAGSSGTYDYEKLINKPQINSVELIGNKSFEDLGLEQYDFKAVTKTELDAIVFGIEGGN